MISHFKGKKILLMNHLVFILNPIFKLNLFMNVLKVVKFKFFYKLKKNQQSFPHIYLLFKLVEV